MRGSTAGLSDTLKGTNPIHYALLTTLDYLFSCVVVAPAIVGYWRSVWELMTVYVFPEDLFTSCLISTIIGVLGHLFFNLTQSFYKKFLNPDESRIVFYVTSRLYTVVFAFVCVNGWRGPWLYLDFYTGTDLVIVVVTTLFAIVALGIIKGSRNLSGAPFIIVTDSLQGYFEVPTMFRTSMSEKTYLYVLDCLFSVLVVGTLVMIVWRGAWVLIDIYLFPEDEIWSAWGSLVLGYTVVAMAFLMQPGMRWLCDRLQGVARLLVADFFLFFSFLGTVNVWRGIWNLLNLYFLPSQMELSCWITHWVCLILLILLKCSNSLLVRGVYIDAEEPAGKCVVFPCYYLRLIFQHERAKKLTKKVQLDMMAKRKQELDCTKTSIYSIDINHIGDIRKNNQQYYESNHKPEV